MMPKRGLTWSRVAGAMGLGPTVLLLLASGLLEAQQPTADTIGVYRRELFEYPLAGRRDPFLPLTAGQQLGPKFEDLELSGVLFNQTVGSVVTITDLNTGKRYRVRAGDSLGDIRVLAIREEEVDFLITAFGVSRRETLRVSKDKEREE